MDNAHAEIGNLKKGEEAAGHHLCQVKSLAILWAKLAEAELDAEKTVLNCKSIEKQVRALKDELLKLSTPVDLGSSKGKRKRADQQS
jgi:hypothetical protein